MGIKKHIPNAITCCNLLCGCVAIILALGGHFDATLFFVLFAAIFDFLDGLAARALKAYSPMGKDLDSLSDMVSFGVAPAVLGYSYSFKFFSDSIDLRVLGGYVFLEAAVCLVPLFIAVFSALRLAKFNNDNRQTENFIGLATPACAILYISLICCLAGEHHIWYDNLVGLAKDMGLGVSSVESSQPWYFYFPLFVVPVLCWLLVSEIPMFSMKFKNLSWPDNRDRYIFLMIVVVEIVMAVVGGYSFPALLVAIITTYIIINLLMLAFRKKPKLKE
ncbi:MAG: CDP-alcohol phosphatidyltransferase family protein [Bacteroidales bacterium]|nr:CDP-alcohol phosphatidyltransferase family protein [Bacteroidales bacterium]